MESILTTMIMDHMLPYMQIILQQPFLPCMRAPFIKVGTLKTMTNEERYGWTQKRYGVF